MDEETSAGSGRGSPEGPGKTEQRPVQGRRPMWLRWWPAPGSLVHLDGGRGQLLLSVALTFFKSQATYFHFRFPSSPPSFAMVT